MNKFFILLALFSFVQPSYSERKPNSTYIDSRMKVVNFEKDQLYTFMTHYGYSTIIEVAPYEVIEPNSIKVGIEGAYDFDTLGNLLFVKPTSEMGETNLFFKTNLRQYHFDISSHRALSRKPRDRTDKLTFNYPVDKRAFAQKKWDNKKTIDEKIENRKKSEIALSGCEKFNIESANFNYTKEGDIDIAPEMIFDNGVDKTYIKMSKKFSAIKSVDDSNKETMVNWHQECGYIVVESVEKRLSFRSTGKVACIRNKGYVLANKNFIKDEG